jgi:hypothetical protein
VKNIYNIEKKIALDKSIYIAHLLAHLLAYLPAHLPVDSLANLLVESLVAL